LNYYNEWDSFAAEWLRELIKEGLVPSGHVDERSIVDVEPKDLHGYTQCHFFAGIGGWSYALQLAGWDSTRPVWTGSPPCQPFSTAGKQKGKEDERHLWPAFFKLIRECKPPTVFGEQVASAIAQGWYDDLQDDMETEGYATGMAVLPACSIGAPHKRNRLFFVADSGCQGSSGYGKSGDKQIQKGWDREERYSSENSLAVSNWRTPIQLLFRDGKWRIIPVEPTLQPLANGVPNRVGILRGAGNAIVPQVAAEFIKAYEGFNF
jgi:DNA (cytosine-5)-methyltransferase 1